MGRRLRVSRSFAPVSGLVLSLTAGLMAGLPPSAAAAAEPDSTESSTPVSAVGGKAPGVAELPKAKAVVPVWPSAGSATAQLDGGAGTLAATESGTALSAQASPGGLKITVSSAASGSVEQNEQRLMRGLPPTTSSTTSGVSAVDLAVLDQATTGKLGIKGVVFTAAASGGLSTLSSSAAPVDVAVDYSSFANAYGGGFSDRLRLVSLPACALTTPEVPACQVQTPVVGGRNDKMTATVSAPVDLASGPKSASTFDSESSSAAPTPDGPQVMAVAAGASSEQGNWGATSLAQATSWAAGSSGGGFSYSVPVNVPPAPGGLTPKISLDYSSAGVDGLTKSTSQQASWIGEGWNYEPGFVERSYRPCRLDGNPASEGDLCWVSASPMTVVLEGTSTRLFRNDADGTWKAEDDSAGWKVERLTGLANGARDGESFTITTRDGTQYRFGSKSRSAGGGALNVEVFGNNAGEPCNNASGFAYSHCPMPYRWNLDQVVDVHGNVIDYNWGVFQGSYGGNSGANVWVYDVYGWLQNIEYGKNVNAGAAGAQHTGRVVFTSTYRCFEASDVCDDAPSANQQHWMDTPWDLYCYTWAGSCGNTTPAFFGIYRLTEIKTFVWNSAGSTWGSAIDTTGLTHQFPSTGDYIAPAGDDSSPSLWLAYVARTGFPTMDFGGTQLDNRVDYGTGKPPMTHWRVGQVNTGTGESINVVYNGDKTGNRDCWPGDLAGIVQDQNTRRCFPQNNGGTLSWWHKYVVTDVHTKDYSGGAPDERWHYDYSSYGSSTAVLWKHDRAWHTPPSERTWSRWAGYPTVTTKHGAFDGSGPQQYSESLFFRGMDSDKTSAGWGTRVATINDDWSTAADQEPLAGQVRRSYTLTGSPDTYRTNWATATRHHHNVVTNGSQYMQSNPTISASRVREVETLSGTRAAGPSDRWTQTLSTFESTYGLTTKVEDKGDTTVTGDEHCVLTSFTTANTAKWLIGLPSEILITDCATGGASNVLAATRTFYDQSGILGAAPVLGLRSKTTAVKAASAYPPATGDYLQTGRSTHDTYSRTLDSYDALENQTTTAYTPTTGGPVTGIAVTGPLINGARWTTTTTLDPKRGLPTKVVDANGKKTEATYDPATGRLLKVWKNNRSTGATPDAEYAYSLDGDNWISIKTLSPNNTQIESFQLFDGRLRLRQTQSPSGTGTGRTIVDTAVNGLGVPDKTSTFYNSTAPGWDMIVAADKDIKVQQRYVYDNLGRTTAQQQWTGNGTTSSKLFETLYGYDGDKTFTVTPPTGGAATTTIKDARGQTTELRQHLGGTPAGAVDVTTKYSYDRLGQLTKVTDVNNNAWTYSYDLLGNKWKTVDPDAGTSTSVFDNSGRVTETVDGNNNKLVYKLDTLGRKTEVRETSLTGTLRASWTYDTLAKGQLTSTSRFDGGSTYTSAVGSYNDAYQPLSTTDTIPGFGVGGGSLTYTVTNTYKANGALATQALPAVGGLPAETLTRTYHNSTGLLNAMTSAQGTYLNTTNYSYDSQVDTLILGATSKRVKQTMSSDPATRRLNSSTLAAETGTVGTYSDKFADSYTYDWAGNIQSIAGITNGVADQEECFRYDHLRRLTEAWTQTSGTCTTPQRTGADPYWRQWSFDSVGNRLTQKDKDTTDTTWTYTVGAAGSVKPHQVKKIDATGPKAGTALRNFGYDTAGNTTSRTTDTGVAQTLTWDKEGHLATLTEGSLTTSYVYNTSGGRLIAKNTNKSILYLSDGTELEKIGAANPLGQRYYGTAVRDAAGLKWIVSNHQGTGTAQIDSVTLAVTRRRSMPYGESRGTPPTWLGTKGFVGGTKDATGLTHLGAREYDPTMGRFISIDAVIDHSKPQQMHGYAYADNSPVVLSDASGLRPEDMSAAEYKQVIVAAIHKPITVKSVPTVSNPTLQSILDSIYARAGAANPVGDGKVAAAVNEEFKTGQPTKGKWHYHKAVQAFNALSALLEQDRVALSRERPPVLTAGERVLIQAELRELWSAINSPDRAGGFTKYSHTDPDGIKLRDQSKRSLDNAVRRYAVADLTRSEFKESTYDGKVVGFKFTGARLGGAAKMLGVFGDLMIVHELGMANASDDPGGALNAMVCSMADHYWCAGNNLPPA